MCFFTYSIYVKLYCYVEHKYIRSYEKFAMTDMKKMAMDYAPVSEVIRKQRCLIIIGV